MLKTLILTILMMVSFQAMAGAVVTIPLSTVKGYQEWKNEKIQAALLQMAAVRGQIQKAQLENSKKNAEAFEKQLDQLKWNLEAARELSVTDYFVLYLSQQSQADRFNQAASKLTTREVAELMEAYANTLGTSAPQEVVVRPSTQPATQNKLPSQAIQVRDQVK